MIFQFSLLYSLTSNNRKAYFRCSMGCFRHSICLYIKVQCPETFESFLQKERICSYPRRAIPGCTTSIYTLENETNAIEKIEQTLIESVCLPREVESSLKVDIRNTFPLLEKCINCSLKLGSPSLNIR